MSKNIKPEIELNQGWLKSKDYPLIISGPCSAESEEQLYNTAIELNKIKEVKIFRVGIWKPRTTANQFEGIGSVGFEWLKKIKEDTSLKIAVEVANPQHVEECIDNNIDIIWLGARTTVNPFLVQEIADELKGSDKVVMIKNPINPDLNLWIGAIKRINNAGIKKIIAIHRGFDTYHKSIYRNNPLWEIPIELKRLYPDLPLICDPSHIAGDKKYIKEISQEALDLEMNGLMIETHYKPEEALTDSNQQITPSELLEVLNELKIRKTNSKNKIFSNKLESIRSDINLIDQDIIKLLALRFSKVEEIGRYKKNNNITILQLKHWSEMIDKRIEQAIELGIEKEIILKILKIIHQHAIEIQNKIMNN